jgi:predicted negative regulator of RcsB-dependent stress response
VAHISRKELKKDEVRDTIAHGAEAVLSHQALTTYLLSAALIFVIAFFGWRYYSQQQNAKASVAYDAAMQSFDARVISAGQPAAQPGEVTFTDDKTKYTEAANKFGQVAAQYPHTHDGQLAKYFAAISDQKIGKNDDARRLLQQLVDSGDADFAAMGRYALAQLDDQTGQADNAVKLYQQLIDKPAVLVPKPVAMLALGQHYSASNPAEAAKLFNQIKTDYPDSPIAEQADQALSLLPGKS